MAGLGLPEMLLILAVVILLFGPKRIPDLAKGLGEGIRNFKSGMQGDTKEAEKREHKDEQGSKK
jgi:sec-independent protein translocase protein TatA